MPEKIEKVNPKEKLILIVDDDECIVELLTHMLQREGFNTDSAYEGTLALKKVQTTLPHLIVLDLMLPGYAGYELLKKFQEDFETRNIPIIVITAKSIDESMRQMLIGESNVREFAEKPLSPNSLIQKIHKILNTKSREDEILEKIHKGLPDELRKLYEEENKQ